MKTLASETITIDPAFVAELAPKIADFLKNGHGSAFDPISEPEKLSRAATFGVALIAFAQTNHGELVGGDIEPVREQNIVDLLANLGHYCDHFKLDLNDLLRRAGNHYEAESPDGVQFFAELMSNG